ncbi:hypothetical protein C9374_010661 [Naegleria lovaniensis]|uniref:Uncharacterized protein n=1 Tax=Naegleria lovaniensis TaxID=51637 RepID=A0AA88GBK5_NAELO|nr:uncharacterized protein C9374_010661 [Naegleria lovaniensis]KAG2374642.1 hypothetical protein C9374_010661 [Naegleria lovaniensis]
MQGQFQSDDFKAILVTMFILGLTIAGPVSAASNALTLEVNPSGPRTDWPDNANLLNLGMWVDYAIFVGIVAVCIVLIGILLESMDCIIWCSRRVCNCCGGSKLEGYHPYSGPAYTKGRIRCMGTMVLSTFVLIVILGGVFVAFNALFSINLRRVISTAEVIISNINGTINAAVDATVIGVPLSVAASISSIKQKTIVPAKQLCDNVQTIEPLLTQAKDTMIIVGNQISSIDDNVNTITNLAQTVGSKLVFRASAISKPDSNLLSSFTSGNNFLLYKDSTNAAIDDALDKVVLTHQSCSYTISDAETKIGDTKNGPFKSAISTIQSGILNILGVAMSLFKKIPPDTVSDATLYVNIGDSVRISIEMVILVVPLSMYLFALVGICFRVKWFMKLSACFSCTLYWLLFLLSALHIIVYIVLNDACFNITTRGVTIVSAVTNMTGIDLEASVGLPTSQLITGVANCGKYDNFVNSTIGNAEAVTTFVTNKFNMGNGFSSGLNDLSASMTIDTNSIAIGDNLQSKFNALNLDYNSMASSFNSSLKTFETDLLNVRNQANATLQTELANSSQNMSSIRSYCVGRENQTLCIRYAEYLNATKQYDDCSTIIQSIRQQLTEIESTVSNINDDLQTNLAPVPTKISNIVTELSSNMTKLVNDTVALAPTLLSDTMQKIISDFSSPLKCTYVPAALNDVNESVCDGGIVLDSLVIGASSFVIGIACGVGFVYILLVDKYITYRLIKEQSKKGSKKKAKQPSKLVELPSLQLEDTPALEKTVDFGQDDLGNTFQY